MIRRKRVQLAVGALALIHGAFLLGGFFAPYDFAVQNRSLPFAPPTRLHFVDAKRNLHSRPFFYQWTVRTGSSAGYEEDQSIACPVRFFVIGAPYKIAGILDSHWHLFGTDEPGRLFLMGSDAYGRDQFSRFLYGGQISLFAGLLATGISLSVGMGLGALAGFYGGWLDEIVMRVAEVFLALPWIYLLFAVRAFLPLHITPSQAFLLLISVIGLIGWARPARLIRGVVLSAREREYVLAAKGFGASDAYLLRRHVLPHAFGVVLAQAVVLIPRYILAEVTLSFLGLGLSEPVPSWGNMLATLQQYYVLESFWWMWAPALALIPIFMAYYTLSSTISTDLP